MRSVIHSQGSRHFRRSLADPSNRRRNVMEEEEEKEEEKEEGVHKALVDEA